ncbi:MAG: enoyl-CoA hydratase-related protein [Acidobacteriota bacterium]
MTTDAELVLVERDGPLAVLTVNRPEKRNALNLALVKRLSAVLTELEDDADLRCVLLTGAGEKAFVAGADIAELRERGAEESLAGINASLFRQVEEFRWPVIAAIRGWTLGGGMELAMACDVRIAAESARFGQPELNLGILPAAGGMHRLPALVGMGVAKDLVLTGRIVDAQEALRMGLVSRVVADDALIDEARSAAEAAAGMAPMASRLAKGIMNSLYRVRPDTAFQMETAAQAILFESQEKKDRMTAFLEKKTKKEKK